MAALGLKRFHGWKEETHVTVNPTVKITFGKPEDDTK
jgi:hypothetical protein